MHYPVTRLKNYARTLYTHIAYSEDTKLHKAEFPKKWLRGLNVQQIWHNILSIKCFQGHSGHRFGEITSGKMVGTINVSFMILKLSLALDIWACGEMDKTFKVQSCGKAWGTVAWMKCIGFGEKCLWQVFCITSGEGLCTSFGKQFYYSLYTHYFYLYGEHLWRTYHVTRDGSDTGPTKMYTVWFPPSKLDAPALLRNNCSAQKKSITNPTKLGCTLEDQWKDVLKSYIMELIPFI